MYRDEERILKVLYDLKNKYHEPPKGKEANEKYFALTMAIQIIQAWYNANFAIKDLIKCERYSESKEISEGLQMALKLLEKEVKFDVIE